MSRHPAYDSAMSFPDDPILLQEQLADLRLEHQDLDKSITHLEHAPDLDDELLLRRLKKRKLLLKDKISNIERMLGPDLTA